ncbi:hypothetical protein GCM10027451_27880 [Geodermatophilus aquaeductus]
MGARPELAAAPARLGVLGPRGGRGLADPAAGDTTGDVERGREHCTGSRAGPDRLDSGGTLVEPGRHGRSRRHWDQRADRRGAAHVACRAGDAGRGQRGGRRAG